MLAFSNENELVWTGPRFVCIRIMIKMIEMMMIVMMMITITIIKFYRILGKRLRWDFILK